MKKRTMTLVISLLLVALVAVGGTLAWLMDSTTEVKNTFTVGDVDITLIETLTPEGEVVEAGVTDWEAQLVPGTEYDKNPTVTVEEDTDVDCYLFVKFEENNDPEAYMTYESNLKAPEWTLVPGETNVWYKEVPAGTAPVSWELLDGNVVKVNEDLTKEDMEGIETPELVYTAYAIQVDNFENVAAAWAEVSK